MKVQLKKQQTNKDNSQYFKEIRNSAKKKNYSKPNERLTKLNEINTVLL